MIACEQGAETSSEDASNTPKEFEASEILDISSDYYGDYESTCISNNSLEFGVAYKYEIELNDSVPLVNIVEYAESNCLSALKTTSHNILWSVTSQIVAYDTYISLNIEFVDRN